MNSAIVILALAAVFAVSYGEIPTVRYCRPGDTTQGCSQCPETRAWVECDIDPCKREEEFGCPLFKDHNTTCISNQCGGCNDEWYLIPSGRRVWCWGP